MTEPISLGLTVQLLASEGERALVLGQVAQLRTGSHHFRTRDLLDLYVEFRLPNPANLSRTLGRLAERRFVVRHGDQWTLTPVGDKEARGLVGDLNPETIAAELVQAPGAELGHERHSLIPASFAPPRWRQGIARLLDRYPFETNVFCMTRFPDDDGTDVVADVVDRVRSELKACGLTLLLASDHQFEDDLLGNIGAFMWACQYGIGLLENRTQRGLNYNAVIEIGSMTITGRRCAMLKDRTAPTLPTDLSGQIYKSVDFDDLDAVGGVITRWVHDDLGI